MMLYSASTAVGKSAPFLGAILNPPFYIALLCNTRIGAFQSDLEQYPGGFTGEIFSKLLVPEQLI